MSDPYFPSPQTFMSSNGCWNCTLRNTIPSDTAVAKTVIDETLQLLRNHGWEENDLFGVHLAFEEAVVNAIKHGNRYSHDKEVEVYCELSDDRAFLEITDEGIGFDPDTVPDPTAEENLENSSGRGLMLMRSFMTHVEFNDLGNKVTMEKIRTAS